METDAPCLYKSIFNNANTLHNLRAHIQNGQATPELQRCKDHDAIPIIYHKNICFVCAIA